MASSIYEKGSIAGIDVSKLQEKLSAAGVKIHL
jgi:hypothetical protein